MARSLVRRWSGDFQVPLADLWDLLIDTDRLDQLAGTPRIDYQPLIDERNQVRLAATARFFGIPMRWVEPPFEWAARRWFRVERLFTRTPFVETLQIAYDFAPLDDHSTHLVVTMRGVARSMAGELVGHVLVGQVVMRRLVRAFRRIEQNYQQRVPLVYPPARHSPADPGQLAAGARRLAEAPVDPALVERLLGLVRDGDDRDVLSLRPFVLADRWGVDRMELLRVCLYAARAGLLDVSWEVLCPNCRVPKETLGSLAALRSASHCDTCNIDYGVTFDEYVELRFNVSPAVRQAYLFTYCVGGPGNSRHILGQRRVPPGQTAELTLDLAAGGYHLRIPRWSSRAALVVSPQGGQSTLALTCAAAEIAPAEARLAAGPVTLRLHNASAGEILVMVEPDAWGMQGASAALVTAMPEFRTLFSSEVLSPGITVALRNMTVMFTDLKASTQLYAAIGDPAAFGLVRGHFRVLADAIERHHGALVKTIGDAVMAVFLAPRDGVAAAWAALAAIDELNRAAPDAPPLVLKLGLHRGSCIAITANDTLDYFGSTVNMAARVQAASLGGDVVVSQAVLEDTAAARLLKAWGQAPERIVTTPRGFSEPITLLRYRPLPAGVSAAAPAAAPAEEYRP